MSPSLRRGAAALGVALVAVGCVQTAKGGVQPLKAMIGQWLLEAAWQDTRANGVPAKPWAWADVSPAAHLSVPRTGDSAVVLGSASGEAMAWGPGHVPGSAPLGGAGLAAIAGHRDSHLAFLAQLRPGDEIRLETVDGRISRYRVRDAVVVDARVWRLPVRHEGAGALALSTCWPFASDFEGPLRFVLTAEEV
ncbi:MAG: class GN sortase [Paracoccaceae bacterium]